LAAAAAAAADKSAINQCRADRVYPYLWNFSAARRYQSLGPPDRFRNNFAATVAQ